MISIDEINRLKAENKELNDIIDGYQPRLQRLKAENERLKEEINEYKKHSKCAWKCFEGTLCEEGENYTNKGGINGQ